MDNKLVMIIRGSAGGDPPTVPDHVDFLSPEAWGEVLAVSKDYAVFKDLSDRMIVDPAPWQKFTENPLTCPMPGKYKDAEPLVRLALTRIVKQDALLPAPMPTAHHVARQAGKRGGASTKGFEKL